MALSLSNLMRPGFAHHPATNPLIHSKKAPSHTPASSKAHTLSLSKHTHPPPLAKSLEKHTVYRLQGEALQTCLDIGRERQATNVRNGVKEKGIFKLSPEERHIRGLFGEMALMKLIGLSTDDLLDTRSRSAKKDTFDTSFTTESGRVAFVDVKTTGMQTATHLQIPEWKRNRGGRSADVFVQFVIRDDKRGSTTCTPYVDVEFVGAVPAERVWSRDERTEVYGNFMYRFPFEDMCDLTKTIVE